METQIMSTDPNQEAFERSVLKAFVDDEGRIKAFPTKEKKYLVILRYVLPVFEHGRRYTEKEVNSLLARYSEDTAELRRGLVDYGYMARERGGSEYWLVEN